MLQTQSKFCQWVHRNNSVYSGKTEQWQDKTLRKEERWENKKQNFERNSYLGSKQFHWIGDKEAEWNWGEEGER